MPRLIATTLLISVVLLMEGPSLMAQATAVSPPTAATPPSPATAPTPASPSVSSTEHATPTGQDQPSLSLKLDAGKLSTAVDQLQAALEAAHKPGVNVLYGPGVQNLDVPQLTLRKVSGTDALRLIAVSAGCQVELIMGDRADVIGYRILAQPVGDEGYGRANTIPAFKGELKGGQPVSRRADQPASSVPVPAMAGAIPGKPPMERAVAGSPSANGSVFGGVPVIGFTASTPQGPMVRVYSLGEITSNMKFNDVAKTLEDLLKAAGVSLDTAKLAVHEKTNVLMVTGDQKVQELVTQLLDALQQNTIAANAQRSRDESARREMIELEMRLNAERDQSKRLQQLLEQSESQLTKVQRELDRVTPATPPK